MPSGGARPGAGRPKGGSKARAKALVARATYPTPPAGGPAHDASLLDQYRKTAEQLEKVLSVEIDPKVVASLSTTLNRTYWHIGQLTGEAQLTEAKIVRSEAWRNILTRFEQVLSKHPTAAADLATLFESLERT